MLARGAFRPEDVWVTHSGDAVAPRAVAAMDPRARALLERQVRAGARADAGACTANHLCFELRCVMAYWGQEGGGRSSWPLTTPACAAPSQEYARLSKGALPEGKLQRPAIAICHSFPECWARGGGRGRGGGRDRDPPMAAPGCPCPPDDSDAVAYRIGRTM